MNHVSPISSTLGGEVVIKSFASVTRDSYCGTARLINVIYSIAIICVLLSSRCVSDEGKFPALYAMATLTSLLRSEKDPLPSRAESYNDVKMTSNETFDGHFERILMSL